MVRVERLGKPHGSEELGLDMQLKTLKSVKYLCSKTTRLSTPSEIDSFMATSVSLNNYSVKDFTKSSIFYFWTVENE